MNMEWTNRWLARLEHSGAPKPGSEKASGARSARIILNPIELLRRIHESDPRRRLKKWKVIRAARQPEPSTPSLTKEMMRHHARCLRDQRLLDRDPITDDEWLVVERDLVGDIRKPKD